MNQRVTQRSLPIGTENRKRLHEMNVAAVFGGETAYDDTADDEEDDGNKQDHKHDVDGNRADAPAAFTHSEPVAPMAVSVSGTMEEEEIIEEEEADLAHYVEELEEDAAFEELEEETHAAEETRTAGTGDRRIGGGCWRRRVWHPRRSAVFGGGNFARGG